MATEKSAAQIASKLSLRIGRRIPSADLDQVPKWNSALSLLGQAIALAKIDGRMSKKLTDQARRIFTGSVDEDLNEDELD